MLQSAIGAAMILLTYVTQARDYLLSPCLPDHTNSDDVVFDTALDGSAGVEVGCKSACTGCRLKQLK